MLLYRTSAGPVVVDDQRCVPVPHAWNDLVNDEQLASRLQEVLSAAESDDSLAEAIKTPMAPLDSQEIWAAGVTYFRSKTARMEESADAGGGDFYDRVYDAERP